MINACLTNECLSELNQEIPVAAYLVGVAQ